MKTTFHSRERFFVGCGPENLPNEAVVFGVDDLSEGECELLAKAVQQVFDDRAHAGDHDAYFRLTPSAEENPVDFLVRKEWERIKPDLESAFGSGRQQTGSLNEVLFYYYEARSMAETIRSMRSGKIEPVYLRCDYGRGEGETFEYLDCLTLDEIDTLRAVLGPLLYETGGHLEAVYEFEAADIPEKYVKAKLEWNWLREEIWRAGDYDNPNEDELDEHIQTARGFCRQCVSEILELRGKPKIGLPDELKDDAEPDPPTIVPVPVAVQTEASESLRTSYRDPDNYWRNVELYQLRKAGKTNAEILEWLAGVATKYSPLETENALRTAIESIAQHHAWPILKGKGGRRRAEVAGTSV